MTAARNTLLDLLPRPQGRLLESMCRSVDLQAGEMLQEVDAPTRHVYFPTGALVCLYAACERGAGVEVAMVGHEGLVGIEAALGMPRAPLTAIVQEGGASLCANAQDFEAAVGRSPPLRKAVDRFAHLTLRQMAASTACLQAHQLSPRLARWLLMTRDRAGDRSIDVTQESLARMLGVRRVGITAAAKAMQRSGLIDYSRGRVTVLDHRGLRSASCNCYKTDRRLYAAMLKPPEG